MPAAPLASIVQLIAPRRRGEAALLLALMLVGALADLVAIGTLLPFLALLAGQGGTRWRWLAGSLSMPVAAALFAGTALIAGLLRLALTRWTQRFAAMTGHDCAVAIQRRLLLQPYGYHLEQHSSTLVAALTKVDELVWRVLLPLLQGLAAAIISVVIFAALLVLEPLIALSVLTAVGGLYFLIAWVARRPLDQLSDALSQQFERRVRLVQDSHGAIRDIILDGSAEVHVTEFARSDRQLAEAQARYSVMAAAPRFLVEALGLGVIALVAAWLSTRPGGLLAALPLLGALALGAQRLLPLLQQLYQSWAALTASRSILADVTGLLALPLPADEGSDLLPIPFTAELRIDGVTFDYPGRERPALDGIALTIRKGDRVALTGPTGSGKSSLADVIMGLLKPQRGQLRIDGRPIGIAERPRWRRAIAHVPQAVFLSDDSIAANVAFGVAAADRDPVRLARAIRLAQLDELIAELPLGAETSAGERGARLSGGQRQRIGLARAIYREAPVLVLDEATSALDQASEAAILRALDQLQAEGTTIIVIAHRRSTLRGCNRIVRLEAGRLVTDEVAVTA